MCFHVLPKPSIAGDLSGLGLGTRPDSDDGSFLGSKCSGEGANVLHGGKGAMCS